MRQTPSAADTTRQREHYYKGDSNDAIDQKALQYYQQFADANPDSNLGKIVREYINVLQTNDFKINDSMEEFYRGLQGRFDVSNLTTNGNNAGQSNGTGTTGTGNGNTGNNGTENSATENSSVESSSTNTSNVEGTNSTNANNTAKK